MLQDLPAEFDPKIYRDIYPDIASLPEGMAETHYLTCGMNEGRLCNEVTGKAAFIALVPGDAPALEIGPFLHPGLRKPRHDVSYFDVMDTEGLINQTRQYIADGAWDAEHFDPLIEAAPHIDYVHPAGDLSGLPDRFNYIYSSHCIEHQVDLLKHLNDVYDLLRPGGYYFVVVPDKRFGFDHYLPETRFVDVLGTYIEGRKLHSPGLVLEHRLETTHNDLVRHWQGDHGEAPFQRFTRDNAHLLAGIWDEARAANTQYIDVHNWKFTPASFRAIMRELKARHFLKLTEVRTYPTLRYSMEFFAVFRRL